MPKGLSRKDNPKLYDYIAQEEYKQSPEYLIDQARQEYEKDPAKWKARQEKANKITQAVKETAVWAGQEAAHLATGASTLPYPVKQVIH